MWSFVRLLARQLVAFRMNSNVAPRILSDHFDWCIAPRIIIRRFYFVCLSILLTKWKLLVNSNLWRITCHQSQIVALNPLQSVEVNFRPERWLNRLKNLQKSALHHPGTKQSVFFILRRAYKTFLTIISVKICCLLFQKYWTLLK